MTIADHFQQIPDAGFVRKYDSNSARRQFTASLFLIAIIVIAASGLCVMMRFDQDVTYAAAPPPTVPFNTGSLVR